MESVEVRRVRASLRRRMFGRDERLCIGRYEIVGTIGWGGMGFVYTALDPELGRRVAIKLTRADIRDEARALARISSPHIVQVLDVGADGDQTYLVMPLIEGTDLEAWLHKRRPWPKIVDAFVAAGSGLADAHEAGLVHRDFKPANVLVGHDGSIRLADFGLAIVAARGRGKRGGTPRYMAPEVLRGGAADARADQYSLCVAMAEALEGADVPARIGRAVARGTDPDSAARWPTVRALLAEIEQARRAPRRKPTRGGVVLVAALALLAAPGAVVPAAERPRQSVLGAFVRAQVEVPLEDARAAMEAGDWSRALAATHRAFEAAEQGGDPPLQAEAALAMAKVLEHTGELDRASEMLARARSSGDDATVARASILLAFVQGIRQGRLDEAAITIRQAAALVDRLAGADVEVHAFLERTRGTLELAAGRYDAARVHFERALTAYRGIEDEHRLGVAVAHNGMGQALLRAGDVAGGLEHFEHALALERAHHGPDARALVDAWQSLGVAADEAGQYDRAKQAHEHALVLLADDADGPRRVPILINLGNTFVHLADYAAAQARFEMAVALLDDAGGRSALAGHAHTGLGNVALHQADFDAAYRHHIRAAHAWEDTLGWDHPQTATAYANAGEAAYRRGKLEAAGNWLQRALEVRRATLGELHVRNAFPLTTLGKVRIELRDSAGAVAVLDEALELRVRAQPQIAVVFVAETRFALARALWGQGEHERALATAEVARAEYGDAGFEQDVAMVDAWLEAAR